MKWFAQAQQVQMLFDFPNLAGGPAVRQVISLETRKVIWLIAT